jgi:DNA-binding response OmpR family regulator
MAKLAGSRPINAKVELPSDSKQHSTNVKSTVRNQRDAVTAGAALSSGSVRHQGCVDQSSPANSAGEESMPSKVLIVDDDKTTREGLAEFLEEAGYEAVAVGTFEEATRVLRTAPPDLLIADVRLGPFNGLQLVISTPRPIPAIIITGFADPVLESDARRRGADYVLKPVSPARLLDLVAHKLAVAARPGFGIPRRWERKPVIGGLPISVDDTPARIVDVSYGGLRFEMQRNHAGPEHALPSSLSITLPTAQLSVKAKLIWENLIGDGTWMCGAALFQETPEWQGLVDAI